MNIVLVGHVCIDHNTTENATYTSWGSSVLYMAHYLQEKHHVAPVVVTSYGPDMISYLSNVNVLPHEPNQKETLVYENDTRSVPRIWKAHKTESAAAPVMMPDVINALQKADILIVAPLLPNYSAAYLKEVIDHTAPESLRVLCPQGYFRTIGQEGLVGRREFVEAAEVLPLFDLVVYSEEDSPKALQLAQSWSKDSDTKIIVTQGEKGANIVEKGAATHIATTPLAPDEIIDSVGCGDVFAVTTAYHCRLRGDLEQAVREAHQSAAQKLLGTPTK